MATRNRLEHDQYTRDKIQTTQLIKRLQEHALKDLELSVSRVKAIEILLRKTLPDLTKSEISATVAILSQEEWLDSLKDE